MDFTVDHYFDQAAQQPDLPVLNAHGTYLPGSLPRYTLTGDVRNEGQSTVAKVEVAGTLYNAGGQVMACESSMLSGALGAGEQAPIMLDYRLRKDYELVTSFSMHADDIGRN